MRAAIVGAGHIAREHIAGLQRLPGVEIVAVCDLARAVAECAAERYRIPTWFTDHRRMLRETRPDVVHVTTPPTSHFILAMEALDAGAHVIVEKPATVTYQELERLVEHARGRRRVLIEDYTYLFDHSPREILRRVQTGEFGAVTHVDVLICLDILRRDGFADPNLEHPARALAGGAIGDVLPHLASLAHVFVGPHRRVHSVWRKRRDSVLAYDEFHAVVESERGTATLGFTANSQPDGCWLRVYGERMQATAHLWETRLHFDRVRGGPRPIQSLLNGLDEGRVIRRSAIRTFVRKIRGGPGVYEGLFELLRRTYQALRDGTALPIDERQLIEVNRLVAALAAGARA